MCLHGCRNLLHPFCLLHVVIKSTIGTVANNNWMKLGRLKQVAATVPAKLRLLATSRKRPSGNGFPTTPARLPESMTLFAISHINMLVCTDMMKHALSVAKFRMNWCLLIEWNGWRQPCLQWWGSSWCAFAKFGCHQVLLQNYSLMITTAKWHKVIFVYKIRMTHYFFSCEQHILKLIWKLFDNFNKTLNPVMSRHDWKSSISRNICLRQKEASTNRRTAQIKMETRVIDFET